MAAPDSQLAHAYQLAKKHRLRIVTVWDRRDPAIPGDYVRAFVIYGRTGRLGRRRDPAALLQLIKQITGHNEPPTELDLTT